MAKPTTFAYKAKLTGVIILCLLLVILIFQNMKMATAPITISLFFWKAGIPPILLIPFAVLVGMTIGYLLRRR